MFISLEKQKIGENSVLVPSESSNNFLVFTLDGVIDVFHAERITDRNLSLLEPIKDDSRLNHLKDFMYSNENFFNNFIKGIFNKNKNSIIDENIYFNKWNLNNVKLYSKFDFLEATAKLLELKYFNLHYYYLDEDTNNFFIISLNKKSYEEKFKYLIYRMKYDPIKDEEMVILLSKNYAPSLIYFYEMYKQEKENNNPFYTSFYIKEPDKKRLIHAPSDNIKKASRILLKPLNASFETRLKKNDRKSNQFAYIKNTSILDNAKIHKNNKHEIKFDIKHFFDSCKYSYWKKYVKFLFGESYNRYSDNIEMCLKEVLINPTTNGLYMGNPLSGVLSNMIMHPFMIYLNNILSKKYNSGEIDYPISVSLYADDITFSTSDPKFKESKYFNKKYLASIIYSALQEYNLDDLKLKKEKTISQNNQRRKVTGLRINHKNEITVERCKYNEMKVLCHYLSLGKPITIPLTKMQGLLSFYLYNDESGKFKRLVNKYKDVLLDNGIILPKTVLIDEVN